jgi:hypothetical protein
MGGWKPGPAPEKGSKRWKDDMAFKYCSERQLLDETQIVKLPTCEGVFLGFMAIRIIDGVGTDYFRVDYIR